MAQPTVNVNLNDLKIISCECGSEHFEPLMIYRILPALYSNTGHEQVLVTQCSRCVACKKLWDPDSLYKSFTDRKGVPLAKQ